MFELRYKVTEDELDDFYLFTLNRRRQLSINGYYYLIIFAVGLIVGSLFFTRFIENRNSQLLLLLSTHFIVIGSLVYVYYKRKKLIKGVQSMMETVPGRIKPIIVAVDKSGIHHVEDSIETSYDWKRMNCYRNSKCIYLYDENQGIIIPERVLESFEQGMTIEELCSIK